MTMLLTIKTIHIHINYAQQYNMKVVCLAAARRTSVIVSAKHTADINYHMHFDNGIKRPG